MKYLLLFFNWILLVTAGTLLAQQENEGTVRARFCAIYWGDGGSRDAMTQEEAAFYYKSSGDYHELRPSINQFGPSSDYLGPRVMPIYRRVAIPEGGYNYEQVSQVQLPQSPLFLLFMSGGDGGRSVHFAAMDVSDRAIPGGGIAFLNFTDKPLAADIRGSQQRVEPKRMVIFEPRESDKPDLPLKIAVFDEEWKPAYATVTRVVPDRSYLMVFYLQGNRDGAYRLRIFRDLHQLRESLTDERAGRL